MSKIKSAYWNVIDGGDYELKPKKPKQHEEQTLQASQALQSFKAFNAASSYQRTNELRNKLKARFNGLAEAVTKAAD